MSDEPLDFDYEDHLDDLRRLVKRATSTRERLIALSDCLAAYEKRLSVDDPAGDNFLVFNQAAYLLGDRVADGVVWDWWQEQARAATSARRQETLRIALFELVPEVPIIRSDLLRLWDFWFDPAARWALFSAYWWFPRRIGLHLTRYITHRRRHGLLAPDFSYEEADLWLKQASAPLAAIRHARAGRMGSKN